MRDDDFSAAAKELMQLPLFSDSSREGGIGWSVEMIDTYLRLKADAFTVAGTCLRGDRL